MAQNYQVSATRSRMDVLLSNPGCCKRAKLGINPLSIVVYDQLLQYQLDIPQNLPIPLTQIFKIQNILTRRYYVVLHVVTAKKQRHRPVPVGTSTLTQFTPDRISVT